MTKQEFKSGLKAYRKGLNNAYYKGRTAFIEFRNAHPFWVRFESIDVNYPVSIHVWARKNELGLI